MTDSIEKQQHKEDGCGDDGGNSADAQQPAPPLSALPPQRLGIIDWALLVLNEPDPFNKVELTARAADAWRAGRAEWRPPPPAVSSAAAAAAVTATRAPARPARLQTLPTVGAAQMPRRRGRQAMLHNLCHVESWAVDLAWDVVARWGEDPRIAPYLWRGFIGDFVATAADEARHFTLLEGRLRAAGAEYGSLTCHDTLWDAAAATAHSLPARLAVEHCCHEARGIDVLPTTVARFRSAGDAETAALLEATVCPDEVAHVAAGVRALTKLHATAQQLFHASVAAAAGRSGSGSGSEEGGSSSNALPEWAVEPASHPTPATWFHALVRRHYGALKRPFNVEARAAAGMPPEWYEPLAGGPAAEQPRGGPRAGGQVSGSSGGGGSGGTAGADSPAEQEASEPLQQQQHKT